MGEPERTAERSDLAWQHLGQTPGTPRPRTANVRQCCGEDKQQGGDRGQRRAALLRGRGFRLPWPSVPAFKASATSGRPSRLSAAHASPRGAATPPHPQAELCWGRGPAPQLCGASPRLTLDERDRGRAGRQHLGHARQRRGLAVVECVCAGEVAGELQGRPGAGRCAGRGRRDEACSASSLAAPGGGRRPRGKRPMKPRHARAPRPPARPVNRHPRGAPRVGATYYPM